MTTKELIELLKQKDPDGNAEVMINGCGDFYKPLSLSVSYRDNGKAHKIFIEANPWER